MNIIFLEGKSANNAKKCSKIMNYLYESKPLFCILCVLLICTSSYGQKDENWSLHQMDDLSLTETKVYLDKPTIGAEIFNGRSKSTLQASKYDRLLFVVDGTCTATVKSKTLNLKTGDVMFLKANDPIKFSTKLKMMIWTSKSPKTDHISVTEKFTKEKIEAHRDSAENVWHSFIETSTMVAGLYMLPKSLNGDDTLVHGFDEINYVVNGSAKFKMNDRVVDVEPGSVMWVKRGIGHYFYELSDDFDVFILFETIHMNHDH